MAKVTLLFAVLLIVLGLAGFLGTGHTHYTALIPAVFGLVLGVCGFLAISDDEHRRMHFMHINATIALLGMVGTFAEILRTFASSKSLDFAAVTAKLAMVWLLFIYLVFCVRSFITARRSGKV
jgi:peptidoglycan/LPS O-acetylase OafA/YrhL